MYIHAEFSVSRILEEHFGYSGVNEVILNTLQWRHNERDGVSNQLRLV